jgi:hypothetical protein
MWNNKVVGCIEEGIGNEGHNHSERGEKLQLNTAESNMHR